MTSRETRVLILGGAGIIGPALRYQLPGAGLSVETLSDDQCRRSSYSPANIPLQRFHYVINCIQSAPENSPDCTNAELITKSMFPHLLAQHCALTATQLIHISFETVFNGIPSSTGKATEDLCPEEPNRALVLRASIFGPTEGQIGGLLNEVLSAKKQIVGYFNRRSTCISNLQLAQSIATIITKKLYLHAVRHISGEVLTHLELVDLIVRTYNLPLQVIAENSQQAEDFCLANSHQDFLDQLEIPPTYNQILEIKAVSDTHGHWHPFFLDAQDLEHADQLHKAGKIKEAELSYRAILNQSPNYMPALVNLGVILHTSGKSEEAILCYRKALFQAPQNAVIYNNIGNSLKALGRTKESARALERAVAINPKYEKALSNLGDVLFSEHRFDEARLALEKALELQPDNDLSWNRLGRIHVRQCRVKEAIKCFRKAYELNPALYGAHSNILFAMHFLPDYSPEEIAAEHKNWNNKHTKLSKDKIFTHPPCALNTNRLRIGFVSDCFKRHPVGNFLHALFRKRDQKALAFICYSDVVNPQPLTNWYKAHSEEWRDISRLSDEQVAQQINDDKIDILIDLAGHTGQSRLMVFARKPAPVQATWMGYINTTGLKTMDFIIADRICIPKEQEHLYTEKVIHLPDDFLCYTAPDFAPKVAPLPAEQNGFVTFGSFNQLVKSTVEVVQAWAKILQAVKQSRLVMVGRGFDDLSMRERFFERFAMAGITENRLALLGNTNHPQLLERYQLIDIALDTFPYAGGTTTCEALWMGVPVITFTGERFCSRHSASHLIHAGLPELVANNIDEYIAKAIQLGTNPTRIKKYRKSLREQCRNSPLCDAKRFSEHFLNIANQMKKKIK